MTVLEQTLEAKYATVNEEILKIIDTALADYCSRSLVSSNEIVDILLDIRRNVTDGGNSNDASQTGTE